MGNTSDLPSPLAERCGPPPCRPAFRSPRRWDGFWSAWRGEAWDTGGRLRKRRSLRSRPEYGPAGESIDGFLLPCGAITWVKPVWLGWWESLRCVALLERVLPMIHAEPLPTDSCDQPARVSRPSWRWKIVRGARDLGVLIFSAWRWNNCGVPRTEPTRVTCGLLSVALTTLSVRLPKRKRGGLKIPRRGVLFRSFLTAAGCVGDNVFRSWFFSPRPALKTQNGQEFLQQERLC